MRRMEDGELSVDDDASDGLRWHPERAAYCIIVTEHRKRVTFDRSSRRINASNVNLERHCVELVPAITS
jgi:hypothetical protein